MIGAKMHKATRWSLMAMVCGAFLSLSASGQEQATSAASARKTVPQVELKDLNGKPVKIHEMKGQVVVVSFWATWCVPCLQELGFLQKYYEKYQKDGLTVLAISTDGPETRSRVRSVARRKGWSLPVLLDEAGTAVSNLNPRGSTPYTLFIDRQGRLANAHEGYKAGDEEGYEKLIQKLVAEPRT